MPKRHVDPPVEWKISIPQSLAANVELKLFDPVRGKVQYAARRDLIVSLLRRWVVEEEQDQAKPQRSPNDG